MQYLLKINNTMFCTKVKATQSTISYIEPSARKKELRIYFPLCDNSFAISLFPISCPSRYN